MPKLLALFMAVILSACSPGIVVDPQPRNLVIRATWSGDYPVAALDQLPAAQQPHRVGAISDELLNRVQAPRRLHEAMPLCVPRNP